MSRSRTDLSWVSAYRPSSAGPQAITTLNCMPGVGTVYERVWRENGDTAPVLRAARALERFLAEKEPKLTPDDLAGWRRAVL